MLAQSTAITLSRCSRCGFEAVSEFITRGLCWGCHKIPRAEAVPPGTPRERLPAGVVTYGALKKRVKKRSMHLPRWLSRRVFKAGYILEMELPERYRLVQPAKASPPSRPSYTGLRPSPSPDPQ